MTYYKFCFNKAQFILIHSIANEYWLKTPKKKNHSNLPQMTWWLKGDSIHNEGDKFRNIMINIGFVNLIHEDNYDG